MEINGKLYMPSVEKIMRKYGVNDGGRVQQFIDSETLKQCDPYIPFHHGTLKQLGILGTVVGSGEVTWLGPYARYLYYGKVMVGKPPKKVTDKDLQYRGAPMRGSFWFERMKADKIEVIIKGAEKIAMGGKEID